MTLFNCLSKIDPRTTDVRFWECRGDEEPPIHVTTMNIDALYKDWWKDCDNCPENGEFIFGIEFSTEDGRHYMLDNTKYMEFPFEKLMKEIEKTFYKNKSGNFSVKLIKKEN